MFRTLVALRKKMNATYCNTLQHTTTRRNTVSCERTSAPHCTTLHHTAPHYSTLHRTAAHYSIPQHTAAHYSTPQHTTAHYSTLQHTTVHYSTPQHTTAHYSTLQHTPYLPHDRQAPAALTAATHYNAQQHSATYKCGMKTTTRHT